MVTARTSVVTVTRPTNAQVIEGQVDCLPGEQVTGGGLRVTVSDPRDANFLHMQDDGPTPTGWSGRVEPTTTYHQGSVFTLTVTALCIPQ